MEVQTFDYIVVGAGSAGSVLANRLSADPQHKVLVLEAGREIHPWSRIPVGFARLIENPAANWLYSSEPDAGTGGRRIPIPRGKLLGGSSSINGMVFVRGQAQDYDQWAQLGNRGWSYREVLPIFRDMESYQGDADDEYRGRGGPLKVTESNETGPLYDCADQGGRRGRHRLHARLQRREAGRHRHDPGDHPQRPPHEHRVLLPRSRARASQPDDPGERADRMSAAGRQALRRRALQRERRDARGACRTRSDRQRRLDQFAAASGTVRHRPGRAPAKPRHRGAARAEGRRREPARSLLAADEMGRAGRRSA